MAADDLALALRMAGQVLVTETTQETRLAVASGSGTERVAFSAVGDTCPLCLELDGKVFRSQSEAAKRFTMPLHIGCDCIWTGVGDDEVGAVDWFTPADEEALSDLIDTHGHFITNPDKYVALKVPAGPTGRDFTFRRGKAGERGTVEWHRPRYDLGVDEGVKQSGIAATGPKFETLKLKTLQTAETISELEAWAVQRFPHMVFDLAKGDPELVRETLGQLDELGRLYRDVEASIPSLKVLPLEEFGQLGRPDAWAAAGADGRLSLNGSWYGDRQGFLDGWRLDRLAGGGPDMPGPEAVISHEFGEVYREWLRRERPKMWAEVEGYLDQAHPLSGLGQAAAESANEAFAEAFNVMHQLERRDWPASLNGLRERLRYEIRRDF